jgi:cobalt-zinc-cadmium efflux system outer membrane protein
MLDGLSGLPMPCRYRRLSCAILLASATVFPARLLSAQTPAPAPQAPAQAPAPPSIAIVPPQTPAPTGEPLTLDAAFARALSANPLIAAARLKRAINLASIDVARERPNPDLHAEVERETPKQDAGIALPIELGGKRSRRIAVAQATVQAGEAELATTILDIRNQVRRAYFSRLLAEARFSVLDEVRQFATRARDAAQARFDVGSAPRLELLQAQLQLAQAENEQASAQATGQAARISLNALLGLPLDSNLPLATGLDAAPNLIGAAALQIAQSANAELAVLDRQIEGQRAKVALAQALRTPDVTPDVTVTHNSGQDFVWGWRVAAIATIPVFTSHRAAVRVEEATLAQLNAQRGAVLARVTGDVTSASALAEAERLAYLRYRDQILPQTLEVERMAEDSYRLGQTNIVALLQALQTSRTIRLQSLQTAQDFQNALSDLERAIGAPIP